MMLLKRRGVVASLTAALLLAVSSGSGAVAAPTQHGGGGGGGGGMDDTGDLYSDLVIALRDVNGLPILAEFEVASEEGVVTEYCVQPVASEILPGMTAGDAVVNPVDGRTVYPIPLVGELPVAPDAEEVEVCDPQPAYAMYVSEAELERLNMARANQDVIDQKLEDVIRRLTVADELSLDGAGRLTIDGLVVDAAPEHAALFQSLMLTGTVPGMPTDPAVVEIFDAWELAAASLGTATSKGVPISIDAALYYVRITDTATSDGWRSAPLVSQTGEEFVDFSGFSYTRDDVFTGCATWLDVPSLTWQTSPVADLADFSPLPPVAVGGTVANVAGFTQLADDARAVINVLHENEVIAGFYLDPVGQDTCAAQQAALTNPAVNWGALPDELVQTETIPVPASAYNPHGGTDIDDARLRVTLDARDPDVDFTVDDETRITLVDQGTAVSVPLALDAVTGNLVGEVGDPAGFLLAHGTQLATTFDMRIGDGAPTGTYELTLELLDVSEASVLATDVTTVSVLPAELTALWTSVPAYVDQDTNAALTARVFNPETALTTDGALIELTLDAPEAFTAATQVTVYSAAVAVPMTLDGDGNVSGTVPLAPLAAGESTSITWYAMVADGAPLGPYFVTVSAVGSPAAPDVDELYVGPAETHGPVDPPDPPDPEPVATINDLFDTTNVAVTGTYVPLVGDFDGTSPANAQDILWYAAGPARDYLWAMALDGSGLTHESHDVAVGGYYQPFVHDFDGNGVDDVFWYAPGAAADYVWFGLGDLDFESRRVSVSGTYRPVPTFAEGEPVVFWHGPGGTKDYLWVANPDRTFTSVVPRQVWGDYQPVPIQGAGGEPGILWYAPGPAPDSAWDGLDIGPGGPTTNVPVTIDGTFLARSAYPAALLYSPTGTDFLIGYELYGDGWTPLPGDLSGAPIVGTSYELGTIVLHAPGWPIDQLLSLIP